MFLPRVEVGVVVLCREFILQSADISLTSERENIGELEADLLSLASNSSTFSKLLLFEDEF